MRLLWRAIRKWKWSIVAIILSISMTYVMFWMSPETCVFGILPVFMSYLFLFLCFFIIVLQVLYEHYTKSKTYYICKSCGKNFTLEGYQNPDARCPFCSSKKLHVIITTADKEQDIKGLVWNPSTREGTGPIRHRKASVGIFLFILILTVIIVAYGYYDYYVRKKSVSIEVILDLMNFINSTALIEVHDLNSSDSHPISWEIVNFTGHLDTKQFFDSGRALLVRIVAFNDSSYKHVLEAKHFVIFIPYLTQSEISDIIQSETRNVLTLPPPPLSMEFDLVWNDGVVERV